MYTYGYTHTLYLSPSCIYIFFIFLFNYPRPSFNPSHSFSSLGNSVPTHIHTHIRVHVYTSTAFLPVTRTDCRAPELMKCQAQNPPPVRTKIIITVSRALSHFICSTVVYRFIHVHICTKTPPVPPPPPTCDIAAD